MYIDNFDLNKTCSIIRKTMVKNMGTVTYTCSTIVSDEPCAIWIASANEQLIHDRLHNPAQFICALSPSTLYEATDKLVSNGTTYRMSKPDDILGLGDIMTIGLSIDG